MGLEEDRTRYPDDRLDDKFDGIREDLRAVKEVPAQVSALSAQVQSLSTKVADNHIATNARFDRMREDQSADTAVLREDNRQVSRVLTGFLSALLVTMVGCIITVIVVL